MTTESIEQLKARLKREHEAQERRPSRSASKR
jgi:hypothetical protein